MNTKGVYIKLSMIVIWLLVFSGLGSAAQSPQMRLNSSVLPQFKDPLPKLSVSGGTMSTLIGNQPITLRMCEFDANVLPTGTFVAGQKPLTRVWGYLADPSGFSTCIDLVNLYKNPQTGALDTYIGPVIVNQRGSATPITYINDLGTVNTGNSATDTKISAYSFSTDQTLHWADPLGLNCMTSLMGMMPEFGSNCSQNYAGPIPAVAHLHGGEVPPEIDGGPDAWFTSNAIVGHKYYSYPGVAGNSALYKYPNTQEASPVWFHDHTLGATRLNVYMGLAGAYYIYDPSLNLPANLQQLTEVVPVVIQDRMFDTNGQLFFPADSAGGLLWALNPEHPYWVPEFVGDTIVVNGKAWPYLNVEPKRYRFLFLNGSNARTYEMFLADPLSKIMGPPMYVIGTDGGYLDSPAKVDPNAPKGQLQRLVMMPGERYEVIIDFSGVAPGTNLVLRNIAKTPFPGGQTPQGSTLGRILQLRVGACTSGACGAGDTSYNPATGTPLRNGSQKIVRLVNTATGALNGGVVASKTRQLTLNEIMGMPVTATDPVTGNLTAYPGGPLEILVNNTKWSGMSPRSYGDFVPITVNGITTSFSEMPQEGDTEVWEIVNLTADAHPIHLHLVQFQLINRQNFSAGKYAAAYDASFPAVPGDPFCIGGVFCPGFGPPLNYNPSSASGGKYGGNPDVNPYLQGLVKPPVANEAGWKDTVIMYPGEVTRIAVRWTPTDLPIAAPANQRFFPFDPSGENYLYNYVWHCHIVDHEDNEMMRPDFVTLNPEAPKPIARPLVKGTAY